MIYIINQYLLLDVRIRFRRLIAMKKPALNGAGLYSKITMLTSQKKAYIKREAYGLGVLGGLSMVG